MSQFLFPRQSILAIAISQTLLFSSVQAFAADEDQISAKDGEEVTVSDRTIDTTRDGVHGMSAATKGKIHASQMSVATSGKGAHGVFVEELGEFNSTGELSIQTSGEGASGLHVVSLANANVERMSVLTTGNNASGIRVANATAKVNRAVITTQGDSSHGVSVDFRGIFEGANLAIKTEGYRSVGVLGTRQNKVGVSRSSIFTSGDESVGVFASSTSSISVTDRSSITTLGKEAHGVYAIESGTQVYLSDSTVETFGEGAAGVKVERGGRVELVNTQVKANGVGAVGAQLSGGTLAVNGGSIQSQNAAAIHVSGQGNTVAIDNAYIGSIEGPAIKVDAGAQAKITVSNGSTLSAGNGRGELLDVQSDSVLDLVVDGSYLHGNLTIPEGGLVNVRLQNGTRFTGQMSDVKNLQLDAGVGWDIMGDSNVESLVLNGGSIDFAKAEGFHQLSMGELSGNGSFGLKLAMENQQVDFLNIEGQATGNHVLSIQNSGAEPESGFDPLQVVHTGGGDAQFSVLGERVDLGAYSYGLERQGDDWFLTGEDREVSLATRSVQALFNSAPTVWYGEMSTLRSRMGEVRSSGQGGAWMRSYGNQFRVAGRDGLGFEQQQSGFSLGVDAPLAVTDGVLLVGLLGGYSKSDLSQSRGSSGTVDSFYVGTYGTWMNNNGYYVDGVLKLNQFQNRADVLMSDFSKAKGSYRNYGLGASLEAGRQIQLTEHLFIEPFAQVSAVAVQGKSFSLDSELKTDNAATHSLLGKVGMTLEHRNQWVSPYIKVALAQEFARDNDVEVNGHRFNNDLYGTRAELGAGLALSLSNNLQLHADFDYMNGQGIEQPWGANVGVRYAFD